MRKYDVANGLGVRATIFFSGCTHNCPNCFNLNYQNFKYGEEWTFEQEDKFMEYVKDENVVGVSILGGEPFQQNPAMLYGFVRRIKEETGKNIWLWTGYEYEHIPRQYYPILKYVDVLIDGKFVEELKDYTLRFRGSSNQRIIDVQKSLKSTKAVLYKL